MIKQSEKYHVSGPGGGNGPGGYSPKNGNNNNNDDVCKNERQELKELLKEEKQRDILRRLPLYSDV